MQESESDLQLQESESDLQMKESESDTVDSQICHICAGLTMRLYCRIFLCTISIQYSNTFIKHVKSSTIDNFHG